MDYLQSTTEYVPLVLQTYTGVDYFDKVDDSVMLEYYRARTGLQEDTVLYRGGAFPHDLVPGMKGKFETFSSTSYNREKAEGYVVEGKESLIKIYAPKGTRGLNGNGHMYGVNDDKHHIGIGVEHEFTLGVGQEYIVVDRNNKSDPPVVEILLI